jgi:hypothetical protein
VEAGSDPEQSVSNSTSSGVKDTTIQNGLEEMLPTSQVRCNLVNVDGVFSSDCIVRTTIKKRDSDPVIAPAATTINVKVRAQNRNKCHLAATPLAGSELHAHTCSCPTAVVTSSTTNSASTCATSKAVLRANP